MKRKNRLQRILQSVCTKLKVNMLEDPTLPIFEAMMQPFQWGMSCILRKGTVMETSSK